MVAGVSILHLARLLLVALSLVVVLRWPMARGKHVLGVVLALELASALTGVIFLAFIRTISPGSSLFQIYSVLAVLSSLLGAVLMLVFVFVMGAELRARLAQENEPYDD